MPIATQPLREEHKELLPHIDQLRVAADSVGSVSVEQLRREVDGALDFLSHQLIPHAQAEEAALYPVVQAIMGAPEATHTMSRDHLEVHRLTEELRTLGSAVETPLNEATARQLRRVLYGLYALVRVHFAKEEEIYLPLLDQHLSAGQAAGMFEHMAAAAAAAKAKA